MSLFNVRQLATLVWLTAEMFPQMATALANEQLINLPSRGINNV